MNHHGCDGGQHSGVELARESFRLLQQDILNVASEGIYGVDVGGRATFVNASAARLTGRALDELVHGPMHELIHHTRSDGGELARHACPIYAAFRDGLPHSCEDDLFWRKDGSSFPVRYTSIPLRREGGITGALVAFQDLSALRRSERALARAQRELTALRERTGGLARALEATIVSAPRVPGIVGESTALLRMMGALARAAESDATVLIQGETGTGKELVASALHALGARRSGPLVKLNCGALPAELVESELFGHERGAFTGALQRRIGRFEQAHGGTLFLDEVAELSMAAQAKLLRVLDARELTRLGSNQTIRVNIRVVAATHRDLWRNVQEGSFRLDLYYRLCVLPVTVPPLRERKEDIPLLVAAFLRQRARESGRVVQGVSDASMEGLLAHDWPGNVRELHNVLERALILADGPLLNLPALALERGVRAAASPEFASFCSHAGPRASTRESASASPIAPLAEHEREHILRALARCKQRIAGPRGAAALLGLHPNTLRSRMERLGIATRG